jgi:ribose/xylose/arabinose/galactoside ABC-type transport system permease subunit
MQNDTLVATLRQNAQLLTRLAVLMGTALVAGTLFQIKTHVFFNGGNLQSILLFMTSVAIVGYGMTIIVVAGELDLSVGSTYGLASMSAALMWKGGMHFLLAAFLGVLVGALHGLLKRASNISFIDADAHQRNCRLIRGQDRRWRLRAEPHRYRCR